VPARPDAKPRGEPRPDWYALPSPTFSVRSRDEAAPVLADAEIVHLHGKIRFGSVPGVGAEIVLAGFRLRSGTSGDPYPDGMPAGVGTRLVTKEVKNQNPPAQLAFLR
jgi:hypothetical protein